MRISDMLRQYNRNVSNGTEELRSVQGTQKLVSTVGELAAGSVFEGTVNAVKGGKVTLALGNGQVITARLDGKVDIRPGTAMFFQVKENDGQTVAIRPYTGAGSMGNPTLLDALTAAQIPVTDRALAMTDAMMQEGMPINRENLLAMIKYVNANPDANVQTIVQMVKLGLPVNEIMAAQFENYLSGHHALVGEMDLAVSQMAELFGSEALSPEETFALYSKVMDIFLGEGAQSGGAAQTGQGALPQEGALPDALAGGVNGNAQPVDVAVTLEQLFSEEQLKALGKALQNVPTLTGNPALFAGVDGDEVFVDTMQEDAALSGLAGQAGAAGEGAAASQVNLHRELGTVEFLRALQQALAENQMNGLSGMPKLFAGKEFQMLLRNVIEQQWLLKPEELKDGKKLMALYEKLERQMTQLDAAMRATGLTQNSFLQTAAEIRGNIEFMNQMNQIYNYVQIPLKMSGQNANGELYVYTNKKGQGDSEGELTAFLHLDMDALGATDVSVRMREKKVQTNFYFESDASYRLVEMHLPILEKRLKNKGYQCTFSITNERRGISFKENFVKKGNVQTGSVHRYSFDVRA